MTKHINEESGCGEQIHKLMDSLGNGRPYIIVSRTLIWRDMTERMHITLSLVIVFKLQ